MIFCHPKFPAWIVKTASLHDDFGKKAAPWTSSSIGGHALTKGAQW